MNEGWQYLKTRQKVNLTIILINLFIFIWMDITGEPSSAVYMSMHGACYAPYVTEAGEYYRLFTCMFLHFSLQHVVYNMLALLFLGDVLEAIVGKLSYLIIYLAGGLAGNICSVWIDTKNQSYAVSAGASGAVFAVNGALLYIMIRNKGKMNEITVKRFLLMTVLSVAQGLTTGGVDNAAHVGGLAGGFILAVLLYHKKTKNV